MTNIADRISSLSPEKRKLFERLAQERLLKSDGGSPLVKPIPRREASMLAPLSFAQQRLWVMDQLQPGQPLYNEHGQLRFQGRVNLAALEECVNEVVRRHEILRLRVPDKHGKPAPEIMDSWHVRLENIDLQDLSREDQERKVRELATRESRQLFDLRQGPLFQIKVLNLAPTENLLLVTLHHLISDAWSMGVFANEVAALYKALLEAAPSPLRALPIQYPDYALWQEKLWEEQKWREQSVYWKERLHDAVPYLDLPVDGRYSEVRSFEGRVLRRMLPGSLSNSIRSLGVAHDVTPFIVFLAAFKLLLSRSSRQQEVSVIVPVSGRNHLDLEPLIGLFINVLVLRTNFEGNPSFIELMQRVREISVAAYRNQEVSFDKLIEELRPERKLRRAPFSDVLFNFLNLPGSPFQLPGLQISREDLNEPIARFPITVYVEDRPQGFVIRFLYQTELFSAERLASWMDQFQRLLEQVTANPSDQIENFTLITPQARQVLPDPSEVLPLVPQTTIVEQILSQAAERPELCAVECDGVTHDYGELTQCARDIAATLIASGLKLKEVVAVTGDRSFGLIAAMLGAFMARGVLLTLDPRLPVRRRLLMMRESCARALICPQGERGADAGDLISIHIHDKDGRLLTSVEKERRAPELPRALPEDPAYIFFTSGTTGVPKGVLGWHMGLGHFLSWQRRNFSISSDDRFAQLTGLSFDVVLRDIFLPLTSGASLCIPEDTEDLGFDKIVPWLKQEGITGIHTTPSIACSWLAQARNPYPLPDLKRIFFAGEPLTDTLARDWRKTFPGPARLINLYGPTETTLAKCFYQVPSDERLRASTQPVGYPLPQTQALIMRDGGRLCGVSELGEIVIRTPFRTLGYINDPEEQRLRFVPNHYRKDPSDLLYHTGDLGRYLPDGAIEIAGRLDNQIKIRGIRIQPEEVASTLSRHPSVQACFVTASKSEDGENTLVAYVVSNADAADVRELRAYLSNELPAGMAPTAFVFLEKLPLTANGKVDRKALPPPPTHSEQRKTAPRTPIELQLAEIWRRTLKVEEIGIDDNFFELGGHSLLAIGLMYETRSHFGVDLALALLFERPTVAGLAAVVEQNLSTGHKVNSKSRSLPAILPDVENRYEPFPLTDIQQAYWVGRSNDLELGNVATHNYSEFEFLDLDFPRLQNAFRQLIQRRDMLRAIVRADGFQRILPQTPAYEIEFHDLRGDEGKREKAIEEIRWRLSHQVLPLDKWPLFEFLVTRWDEHTYRLHISLDAIICDAWSRRILGRELLLLYHEPDRVLPPLELSFRDYVISEHAFRETEAYRESEEYWEKRLSTIPPSPQLPLARNLAELVTPRFVRFRGEIDAETWRRIKGRAGQAMITPSAFVCAVYAEALAAWSASLHFTINLTLFQRMPLHPQVNDVVGDFTSLILLEVNHLGDCFEKRARQIQERLWRDLDHSFCGGVKVLRKLRLREAGVARALMPVVLTSTLVDEVHSDHELISTWRRNLRTAISQTPQVYLDHQVSEVEGRLYFNWDFVKEVFPEGVVEEMFAAYCSLLRRLGEEKQAWVEPRRVEGLLPAGQRQRRREANATERPREKGLIQDAFFAQAQKRGEEVAVVGGGNQLSYRELAEYASGYGELLRELGAEPNRLVAIVMEKGWEQVAAALAVVESGAAYLPIDAAWPEERRKQLLDIGQVEVALTQRKWADQGQAWPAGVKVVVVEEGGRKRSQRLEKKQIEEDLAYVIFTSGSTGVPKGVMMDHRAVWNTIAEINRQYEVRESDVALGISSLSFDLSVYDIFGVLGAGGKLGLAGAEEGRDPERWLEEMRNNGVSVWNSVPALMEMLVEYVEGRGERLPESLRLVMMSGDWIPVSLPGRIKRLGRVGLRIMSLGGATEAAIWSIEYPIGEVEEGWKSIPYGKPLSNQRFYVLKENGEMSPDWTPGELYIGGAGLAQGYWRDEEKTAERFVWHEGLGERLYRTGDLGRYLPDGNIEFLGREDAQVKIQGYRIELGEVESALRKHEGVKEALVTVVGNPGPGAKRLAAYVVPRDNAIITEKELRSFLAALLPEHMAPHALMVLDSFPLNANGKVDRKALPAPKWSMGTPAAVRDGSKSAPKNMAQEIISSLCAEFLRCDEIGAHDNLFALGADSVMAVRILTKLRDTFQVNLSLRAFFEEPTVAALSEAVILATGNYSADLPPIEPPPAGEKLYLSFAQERLWFLCYLEPQSPFYNLAVALHLAGSIDAGILQQALNALTHRHEAFHTSFSTVRGQAVLRISPDVTFELQHSYLEEPSSYEIAAKINHEFRQPFDLEKAPLLRGRLFRINPSEHILVLTVHHIISDAWSLDILTQELAMLYAGIVKGDPPQLTPLPLQYSAFAYWQRKPLGPEYLETELNYWQRALDGAKPLDLRTDKPRPTIPARSSPGAREVFALSAELSKSLEKFSKRHGVTLYMALLAGFYIMLRRHSGQNDIIVSTSVSNRREREMRGVIGCFLNTVLLRLRCSATSTIRELLQQVREVTVGAYAHQTVPFEEVAKKLGDRALSQALSSRVVFGLRASPSMDQELPGMKWKTVPLERGTAKFELEIQLVHRDGGLSGFADYDASLFEPQTITRFLQEFQTILLHISSDEDFSIQSFLERLPPLRP